MMLLFFVVHIDCMYLRLYIYNSILYYTLYVLNYLYIIKYIIYYIIIFNNIYIYHTSCASVFHFQ